MTKFIRHSNHLNFEGFVINSPLDDIDNLSGIIEFMNKGGFPDYRVDEDKWYPEEEDGWSNKYEMQFNYWPDGRLTFTESGEFNIYSTFYIYDPIEFSQLIKFVQSINSSAILNSPIRFREYKFSNVIKNVYVTVPTEENIKICKIENVKKYFNKEQYNSLMECIFKGEIEFLLGSNWELYAKNNNLPTIDGYYNKISILHNLETKKVTDPFINHGIPYLAFELSEEFSHQYFYDYVYYSKAGLEIFKSIYDCLLKDMTFDNISVIAPNNFVHQIQYSTSFRSQLQYFYDEIHKVSNYRIEQIYDLKTICMNRREYFHHFILNNENMSFLNDIMNPLPFILDKTYRTYYRSFSDFDRQTYGGRLLNYILRSIVIYPLQEIIYLKLDRASDEIGQVLDEINSGKAISDGVWVRWFNIIAKFVNVNEQINLVYFGSLIKEFQKLYQDILAIIPQRNNWAHYREHSAEYQKQLDGILPNLLSGIRKSMANIDIIYVLKQEYISEQNLIITAKKIMGYEIDIETVEIQTNLAGNYFLSKNLYAYKKGANYTVPLSPYLNVSFEKMEIVKMGIFDKNNDGNIIYVY